MAHYIRPDADISLGEFTDQAGGTTNIYTRIDETVADDADYIKDPDISTGSIYTCSLSNPSEAIGTGPLTFRLRYAIPSWVSGAVNFIFSVFDVSTGDAIGQIVVGEPPATSPTTRFTSINQSAFDPYGYDDLGFKVEGSGVPAVELRVYWMELELPSASTATAFVGALGSPFRGPLG